jgi:hypothetical protein
MNQPPESPDHPTTAEPDRRPGVPTPDGLRRIEERLAGVERSQRQLRDEVRTRRLVVTDDGGRERLVAEIRGSTMELRLTARQTGDGSRPAALLYVTEGRAIGSSRFDLGPAVGLQLWADGDAVAELDAWPDESGTWHPHLHLGGGG